jgi:tetratricopeptide (TPR) repeat protein
VWDRRALNEIEVPESVRAVVGRRLAQVSDDTQELLRSASVLGTAFTFDDLEAMVGHTEVEIERALEEAIAAGLVREMGRDRYAFNHALTQQSLYSELPSRRRRRLHLAAGDAIEGLLERKRKDRTGELAWHFLEGDDPERALRYSLAAGKEARTVFAWSEAERHFQTALELAEELSDRSRAADARFNLAETLRASGRFEPALPHFEETARAYAELDDALGQARALQNAGFLHSQAGRRDVFIAHQETVSQLAARLETYPPSRELALFYDMYSSGAWSLGHASEGLERIERGLDVARAVGDENLVLHMEVERLERLGTVGRAAEALAESEAIIPRAEARGDLHALYVAVSNAAENAMFLGRLKDSLAYRRRDAELAARLGQAFESVFALSNLAQIETYLGNLVQARSYAQRALSESETLGMGFGARAARVNLGEIAMTVGDWDEARRVLEEATRSTSGSMQIARYAHREFALLEIATGQPVKAAERLQPLLDNADPNDTDIPFLLPVLSLAYTLIGDTQRGETLARRVLDETPEMALACVDAWPALGIALAQQARRDEADDAFERGVDLARAMEYPYAEATALSSWGAETGSRENLEDALAIFRLLGARKDVERVEALLAERA